MARVNTSAGLSAWGVQKLNLTKCMRPVLPGVARIRKVAACSSMCCRPGACCRTDATRQLRIKKGGILLSLGKGDGARSVPHLWTRKWTEPCEQSSQKASEERGSADIRAGRQSHESLTRSCISTAMSPPCNLRANDVRRAGWRDRVVRRERGRTNCSFGHCVGSGFRGVAS